MPDKPLAPDEHLSPQVLDDFFAGVLSITDVGVLAVAHLVERCPECRRRLEESPIHYREALAEAERRGRALVEEIEAERRGLRELLAELLPLGGTEALLRVAGDRRYRTVAFVEHELAVGWEGLLEGAADVADGAWRLAFVALRGLDVGRYGKLLAARLEAELWLLEARRAVVAGDLDLARAGFRTAAPLLRRAGRPADLGGLELLTGAELRLAEGRVREARRFAEAASGLLGRGGTGRWRLEAERLIARIDRAQGRPRRAADRLLELLGASRELEGALEWALAREAFAALVEAESLGEAAAWLLTWWADLGKGEDAPEPGSDEEVEAWWDLGWASGEEAGERELILGMLLRVSGQREAARSILESARRRSLSLGRGRDALAATLELLRLHLRAGDEEALREELGRIERLALCPGVPRRALRELARFAAGAWRGRVGDLQPIERALLLDPRSVTPSGRNHDAPA